MGGAGEASDSESTNNIPLSQLAMDAFDLRRDPRSAWGALHLCLVEERPLPDWVRAYFIKCCERLGEVSRSQHLISLWEALDLASEKKADGYDIRRDPEYVYEIIENWRVKGIVKSVLSGSEKYRDDYLHKRTSVETVRAM